MKVTKEQIYNEIKRVFVKYGMKEKKAEICAQIHTESTLEGILSHGIGRVARFAEYLKKEYVDPDAEAFLEKDLGAIKIFNGNMGPGVLNALYCADEGMKTAEKYGISLIGLHNTTHWMRGGSYGLYVARKGFMAIMWTNTESVMPPWGTIDSKLGNNPIVFAVPAKDGKDPIVMDMAMSQYSYGKLAMTRQAGKTLSYPGGYDKYGNLTNNPKLIEESRRILPMGYWKGSSLAFMLDIMGSILSNGIGTAEIDGVGKGSCGGCSQVMIIIDPNKISDDNDRQIIIDKAIAHIKSASPMENSRGGKVPGEDFSKLRHEHEINGIEINDELWNEICRL